MSTSKPFNVCFVCLGNICRSPLAEGVFQDLLIKAGLETQVLVHSAGTGSWHVGSPPDRRMQATAKQHGVRLNSRAQQFQTGDFRHYDLVLAMDHSNFGALEQMGSEKDVSAKLKMFRSFDPKHNGNLDVPDPYYGGDEGFEHVFDIVHRTCPEILSFIKQELK